MAAVGKKVILGGGAHRIHQALSRFALQEAHDMSHLSQRKAALAELTDDGNFGEVVERINAFVTVTRGYDDASLIPPLQLTQADAGQLRYIAGCEGRRQVKESETKLSVNV